MAVKEVDVGLGGWWGRRRGGLLMAGSGADGGIMSGFVK